jgi:hypothetical protein
LKKKAITTPTCLVEIANRDETFNLWQENVATKTASVEIPVCRNKIVDCCNTSRNTLSPQQSCPWRYHFGATKPFFVEIYNRDEEVILLQLIVATEDCFVGVPTWCNKTYFVAVGCCDVTLALLKLVLATKECSVEIPACSGKTFLC